MGIEIAVKEALPLLEKALHPRNVDRVRTGNYGNGAFVYVRDNALERINRLSSPLHITIGASAGDGDEGQLESLANFKDESYSFGKILGRKIREYGRDVIVATGGCPSIPDWVSKGIAEANKDAVLAAFLPWTERRLKDGVTDKRVAPDPRDKKDPTLSQYHLIFGVDQDVGMRSTWVGTADLSFFIHGGSGSLIEIATAIDQGSIVACYDPKAEKGIVKGIKDLLDHNYKRGPWVYFENSDPDLVVERAFVEHEAKERKLWTMEKGTVKTNLRSVVLYRVECRDGIERYFINERACDLPVTGFHRRGKVKLNGKRMEDKVYHPLIQYIIAECNRADIMGYFEPLEHSRIKPAKKKESGTWIRYHSDEKDASLDLMIGLNSYLRIKHKEMLYQRVFSQNLGEIAHQSKLLRA